MPDVREEEKSPVLAWVKRIGELRDGLLVGASLLYGLGYLVWSLNAWVENLGLLPLIDSQYFMAGTVPAVILWLAYLGFSGLKRLMHQLPSWIGPGVKGWRLILRWVTLIGFWGSSVSWIVSLTEWCQREFPEWALSGPYILIAIWSITALFYAGAEQETDRAGKWYALYFTYFIPVGLASLVVSAYIGLVHPNLPHELGGSRPRCAYLDIIKAQVSDETLRDIVPPDAINSDRQVVRSIKLAVFYSGSDFMLVKPYTEPRGGGGVQPRVYEIGKGVIEAANWCGQGTDEEAGAQPAHEADVLR